MKTTTKFNSSRSSDPLVFESVDSERNAIEITDSDYRAVAQSLIGQIDQADYFSGSVETAHHSFHSTLTTTLIIYRGVPDKDLRPNGVEYVPVWWEFHTDTPYGEVDNDFSFRQFKPYLNDVDCELR